MRVRRVIMSKLKKISFLIFILMFSLALVFLVAACNNSNIVDPVEEIHVDNFDSTEVLLGQDLDVSGAKLIVRTRLGKVTQIPLSEAEITGFDKTKLGEQAATIWYKDVTTQIKITVKDSSILSISINQKVDNITVTQGHELDLQGKIAVEVVYENSIVTIDTISSSMISGYDKNFEIGEHQINIIYSGFSAPLNIKVIERQITGVSIDKASVASDKYGMTKTKLQYFVGEEFNPTGLALAIKYGRDVEILQVADIPEDEITFEYDFSIAGGARPVLVRYKGFKTLATELTAVVAQPKVVEVLISGIPRTKGFTIDGVHTTYPLNGVVEGDQIDWATGELTVNFDNGDSLTTGMLRDDIYIHVGGRTGEVLPKDYRFTKLGINKLYIVYHNESAYAELDLNVVRRTPVKLELSDYKGKFEEDYVDGQRVTTDFLRYNVLFNNRTYLVNESEPKNWYRLTEDMLADDGSTLTMKLNDPNVASTQIINFNYAGVVAGFSINVIPNTPTSLKIGEPTKNYVLKGATRVPLGGSFMLVQMRYGSDIHHTPISEDYVSYENANGDVVTSFQEVGEYKIVVKYKGLEQRVVFHVEDKEVVSLTHSGIAQIKFDSFNDIPFNNLLLTARYRTIGGVETTESIPFQSEYLYKYDQFKVGLQQVQIRYKGHITYLPVEITKNVITSIRTRNLDKFVYNVGDAFQPSILFEYVFSNGSTREEEIYENNYLGWTFSGYNMSIAGKQTVTATNIINDKEFSFEFEIDVLEEGRSVYSLAIDHTQRGMQVVNGQQVWVVGYKEDINTKYYVEYEDSSGIMRVETGNMKLGVKYTELGDYEIIDLLPQYILKSSYDKNSNVLDNDGNLVRFRKAVVSYGGKEVDLNIYIASRKLESISVYKAPKTTNYAVGQELNLEEGVVKMVYNNSTENPDQYITTHTYAILPMTDLYIKIPGYDKEKSQEGSLFVTQTVLLGYGKCETEISVNTYRKVHVVTGSSLDYLTLGGTSQKYGTVSPAFATIKHTVASFTPPVSTIKYYVHNEWKTETPSLPGKYGMKLIVTGNEYFEEGEYDLSDFVKFQINQKDIEIKVNVESKEYGETEPTFTWETTNGTSLEPGDEVYLIITREQGDVVKYNQDGTVGGYEFYVNIDQTRPGQSDRYIIIKNFKFFTINPKRLTSEAVVTYTPVTGSGGNRFSAMYTFRGGTFTIKNEDLKYYDSATNELLPNDGPPTIHGNYYVTLSNNYILDDPSSARHYFTYG